MGNQCQPGNIQRYRCVTNTINFLSTFKMQCAAVCASTNIRRIEKMINEYRMVRVACMVPANDTVYGNPIRFLVSSCIRIFLSSLLSILWFVSSIHGECVRCEKETSYCARSVDTCSVH